MTKTNLKALDTYVYIDASNIRNAIRVSGYNLDWNKLINYFKTTYQNLHEVMYFEGVDRNDTKKIVEFNQLRKMGYVLKTLSRKSYQQPEKIKTYTCKECKAKNKIVLSKSTTILKSNIDVFLCSEAMSTVQTNKKAIHIIILSCDGDFAEMIRKIIEQNLNVYVSVFATPYTKTNNYLSVRLKEIERIDQYYLVNILNIKDKISTSLKNKNESHTEVGLSNGK